MLASIKFTVRKGIETKVGIEQQSTAEPELLKINWNKPVAGVQSLSRTWDFYILKDFGMFWEGEGKF